MAETIYLSFLETVGRYPNKTALMYRKEGRYLGITYKELRDSVDMVAASIRKLGISKGDNVGIFSSNRPEWAIADLAVLKLGGVIVPIYHTLPSPYVKYVVSDSKIRLIFVENAKLFSLIESVRNETPDFERVVLFDDSGISAEKDFLKFDDMKETEYRAADEGIVVSGDDPATIVYTSGTTGEPKGAILTHSNIVSNALSAIDRYKVTSEDVIVSYLPLSHMLERTGGYYTILFAGGTIAYAEDLLTMLRDVAEIRPTLLIAVPRIIEKVYDKSVEKVAKSPFIKRVLLFSAIKNLNKYANLKYKKLKIPLGLRTKCAVYNALVASKFRRLAGGRLRLIVSGGAPLDPQIAKVLYILGFNIVEGYGLTETSPTVCSNTVEENRLGTVGKPVAGVEVRIGPNDEILVKGPNVMRGYLNKPEETRRAIDNDGWFHTGDQGRFDEHGNLIVTGRIKEIIVTSYGKNIAPAPIEMQISGSRYIEQVILCGDGRNCVVALVVPNRESVEHHARERELGFDSYPALLEMDEIRQLIEREIEDTTATLASYQRVKAFALLSEDFTVENGMLTSMLKLRRGEIGKRHAGLIDAIYENLEKRNGN